MARCMMGGMTLMGHPYVFMNEHGKTFQGYIYQEFDNFANQKILSSMETEGAEKL